MIRVLLADDHQLLRQGVRRLLEGEPDIQVVGEASDGLEVQKMAHDLQPDVILMDVSMGVVDGISATRQIVRQHPWMKIVMLTMHSQDGHLFQALQAGATGYILKTSGAEQVLAAVREAANGNSVIAPQLAGKVLTEFRRMASASSPKPRCRSSSSSRQGAPTRRSRRRWCSPRAPSRIDSRSSFKRSTSPIGRRPRSTPSPTAWPRSI